MAFFTEEYWDTSNIKVEIPPFPVEKLEDTAMHGLIIGPTKSGKNYFFLHKFLPPYLASNNISHIFYWSDHIENKDNEDLRSFLDQYYPDIIYIPEKITEQKLYQVLDYFVRCKERANQVGVELKRTMFIFNDINPIKLSKAINDIITWVRHLNVDCFFMVQYYAMLKRIVRANVSLICIKRLGSQNDVKTLHHEVLSNMSLRKFTKLHNIYTQECPETKNRKTLLYLRPDNDFYYMD